MEATVSPKPLYEVFDGYRKGLGHEKPKLANVTASGREHEAFVEQRTDCEGKIQLQIFRAGSAFSKANKSRYPYSWLLNGLK